MSRVWPRDVSFPILLLFVVVFGLDGSDVGIVGFEEVIVRFGVSFSLELQGLGLSPYDKVLIRDADSNCPTNSPASSDDRKPTAALSPRACVGVICEATPTSPNVAYSKHLGLHVAILFPILIRAKGAFRVCYCTAGLEDNAEDACSTAEFKYVGVIHSLALDHSYIPLTLCALSSNGSLSRDCSFKVESITGGLSTEDVTRLVVRSPKQTCGHGHYLADSVEVDTDDPWTQRLVSKTGFQVMQDGVVAPDSEQFLLRICYCGNSDTDTQGGVCDIGGSGWGGVWQYIGDIALVGFVSERFGGAPLPLESCYRDSHCQVSRRGGYGLGPYDYAMTTSASACAGDDQEKPQDAMISGSWPTTRRGRSVTARFFVDRDYSGASMKVCLCVADIFGWEECARNVPSFDMFLIDLGVVKVIGFETFFDIGCLPSAAACPEDSINLVKGSDIAASRNGQIFVTWNSLTPCLDVASDQAHISNTTPTINLHWPLLPGSYELCYCDDGIGCPIGSDPIPVMQHFGSLVVHGQIRNVSLHGEPGIASFAVAVDLLGPVPSVSCCAQPVTPGSEGSICASVDAVGADMVPGPAEYIVHIVMPKTQFLQDDGTAFSVSCKAVGDRGPCAGPGLACAMPVGGLAVRLRPTPSTWSGRWMFALGAPIGSEEIAASAGTQVLMKVVSNDKRFQPGKPQRCTSHAESEDSVRGLPCEGRGCTDRPRAIAWKAGNYVLCICEAVTTRFSTRCAGWYDLGDLKMFGPYRWSSPSWGGIGQVLRLEFGGEGMSDPGRIVSWPSFHNHTDACGVPPNSGEPAALPRGAAFVDPVFSNETFLRFETTFTEGQHVICWQAPLAQRPLVPFLIGTILIEPNLRQDCVVGSWTAWSECKVLCGAGSQMWGRRVTTPWLGSGKPCPSLEEMRVCHGPPCTAIDKWNIDPAEPEVKSPITLHLEGQGVPPDLHCILVPGGGCSPLVAERRGILVMANKTGKAYTCDFDQGVAADGQYAVCACRSPKGDACRGFYPQVGTVTVKSKLHSEGESSFPLVAASSGVTGFLLILLALACCYKSRFCGLWCRKRTKIIHLAKPEPASADEDGERTASYESSVQPEPEPNPLQERKEEANDEAGAPGPTERARMGEPGECNVSVQGKDIKSPRSARVSICSSLGSNTDEDGEMCSRSSFSSGRLPNNFQTSKDIGIVEGTILFVKEDGEIFASPSSWEEVGAVSAGGKVVAAGPPVTVDGYTMTPIQPTGAVDLALLEVADGDVLLSRRPWQDGDRVLVRREVPAIPVAKGCRGTVIKTCSPRGSVTIRNDVTGKECCVGPDDCGILAWMPFQVEDRFCANIEFESDSQNPALVKANSKGTVMEVDDDGDVLVKFDGLDPEQWIFSAKLVNLTGLAERAEKESQNIGTGVGPDNPVVDSQNEGSATYLRLSANCCDSGRIDDITPQVLGSPSGPAVASQNDGGATSLRQASFGCANDRNDDVTPEVVGNSKMPVETFRGEESGVPQVRIDQLHVAQDCSDQFGSSGVLEPKQGDVPKTGLNRTFAEQVPQNVHAIANKADSCTIGGGETAPESNKCCDHQGDEPEYESVNSCFLCIKNELESAGRDNSMMERVDRERDMFSVDACKVQPPEQEVDAGSTVVETVSAGCKTVESDEGVDRLGDDEALVGSAPLPPFMGNYAPGSAASPCIPAISEQHSCGDDPQQDQELQKNAQPVEDESAVNDTESQETSDGNSQTSWDLGVSEQQAPKLSVEHGQAEVYRRKCGKLPAIGSLHSVSAAPLSPQLVDNSFSQEARSSFWTEPCGKESARRAIYPSSDGFGLAGHKSDDLGKQVSTTEPCDDLGKQASTTWANAAKPRGEPDSGFGEQTIASMLPPVLPGSEPAVVGKLGLDATLPWDELGKELHTLEPPIVRQADACDLGIVGKLGEDVAVPWDELKEKMCRQAARPAATPDDVGKLGEDVARPWERLLSKAQVPAVAQDRFSGSPVCRKYTRGLDSATQGHERTGAEAVTEQTSQLPSDLQHALTQGHERTSAETVTDQTSQLPSDLQHALSFDRSRRGSDDRTRPTSAITRAGMVNLPGSVGQSLGAAKSGLHLSPRGEKDLRVGAQLEFSLGKPGGQESTDVGAPLGQRGRKQLNSTDASGAPLRGTTLVDGGTLLLWRGKKDADSVERQVPTGTRVRPSVELTASASSAAGSRLARPRSASNFGPTRREV